MVYQRRTGTEPVTARSPLRLRAALSAIALVLGLVGSVIFLVLAVADGGTGYWVSGLLLDVIVIIAAVDLWVIRRRLRELDAQEDSRSRSNGM